MSNQEEAVSDVSIGFSIDPNIMFSDAKDRYKKGIERRQRNFAKKTQFLENILDDDEKVSLVTMGYSPMGIWEQIFTGSIIFYIKRSLFAFTNKRIIHIYTTYSYKYRNSLAEIRYADCESILQKGRALKVKYKSGKKETFHYIARRERKKVKSLLQNISYEGTQNTPPERTHLCPRCTKPLEKDVYTCQSCRLEFKSKSQAKMISLIYPGGGYFYTRHPFLGLSDALVELFLLFIVIALLFDAVGGTGDIGAAIFWFCILALEKAMTVYHSNHFINEYIPKDKTIKPVNLNS